MTKTFAHNFQEELKLVEQVAKKWGYELVNQDLSISKAATHNERQVSINQNINPRSIDKNTLNISAKHRELNKEMENYEYDKQMKLKASHRGDEEFNPIRLLNDRIREYNYLLDHKHIKDKDSQDTKRLLKKKPKTEAEIILEQIIGKNHELQTVEDLQTQFKLNKQITELYRQYKQKMYDDSTGKKHGVERQTTKSFYQTQTLPTNNQKKFTSRTRQTQSENRGKMKSETKPDNRSQMEQMNLLDPYVSKQFILRNQEIERKLEADQAQLQVYKFKASQARLTQPKRNMHRNKKSTPNIDEGLSFDIEVWKSEKKQYSETPQHRTDMYTMSLLKEKRTSQLKYLSGFLEKRNRKYKKPWGNKILIKYDSNSQAKQMLEGQTKASSLSKSRILSRTQKTSPVRQRGLGETMTIMNDEDREVFNSMKEGEDDEDLYQTMCKNEKINLFLKARKNIG